ncbi:MAG: recombinase family protein [Lachnospiraceae bacterium]|nr:recombinase family protein [Lachnospiraceae bacterium]
MGNCYGYIRVSSHEQNPDRQLAAMHELHIPEKNIYLDKVSGKDFDREGYKKLFRKLKKGDTLYIKSIDRLGRNYREIIEQWQLLTRKKQVYMVVLDMSLLDTRRGGDLLDTFISELVLQILSYVAENERTQIRQRQEEGIAAAKAKGVRFGRPPRETGAEFAHAYARWKKGEISQNVEARQCGMAASTFRYKIRKMQLEE